jgi:DNA-binding NarL/FixJ family response regulator
VLVSAPKIMLDIIGSALLTEPGIEIVGEVADGGDLLAAAADRQADVIIDATRGDSELARYEDLLWSRPATKVVAVADDGRRATLLELVLKRTPLGELGPHDLGPLIRAHTRKEAPGCLRP